MTTDRRWNGWGLPAVDAELPGRVRQVLVDLVGAGTPPRDVTLDEVAATVPGSRISPEPGLSLDAVDRIRHARGQDVADWIALRTGRLPAVPDAVARPTDAAAARDLLERAAAAGWTLVPFGGGTSVVGGVTVVPSERPVVSVDMSAMAGLRSLDAASGLATFGAGSGHRRGGGPRDPSRRRVRSGGHGARRRGPGSEPRRSRAL
ncbi:MAG: FAD-binding protein [Candidatus Limnocylindrales bacterium]